MHTHVAPRYHHQTLYAARTVSGLFGLYGLGDTPPDGVVQNALAVPGVPPSFDQTTGQPVDSAAPQTNPTAFSGVTLVAVLAGVGIASARGAAAGAVAARSMHGAARGALFDGGLASLGAGLAYALLGGDGSKTKALAFGGVGIAALTGSIVWAMRGSR